MHHCNVTMNIKVDSLTCTDSINMKVEMKEVAMFSFSGHFLCFVILFFCFVLLYVT